MNPISEKSDVGGVSNSNVTDAGRFDGEMRVLEFYISLPL